MHKAKLNIQLFASGTINASSTTMPSGTGKVEWSSSVISGKNQSTVTAICYCRRTSGTGNYCTVSGSIGIGSQSKSISKYRGSDDKWNTTWKEVGRFTTTVNHDANGTKAIKIAFTISADTGGLNGTAKGDRTVQLDTINRASKLNAIANFNISDTITISIDKYVTDAVDTLQVKLGDTVIKEVANITDGYQLSFTDAEKTTISNLVSAPQATLTFLLTTVNGETVLGSSTQTAVATLSSGSYFREIYKKENGKYQVAINGFVNTEINDVLQVYDDNGNEILNGKVLYDNSTGTNGTVTLSDSAANYEYVDIFYRDNDDTYSSVRVNNPNGKNADISTIERWGNTLYIKQKRITISGNKITNGNATEANFTTAPKIGITTTANNIYITKVIGYHDTPKQVNTIPMSDMYYKPGDVYTITDRTYITVGGSLTASKGQVRFGVFLPKLLTNINSVTVSLAKLTIRNTSGSYIIDYKDVTSALSASKSGDNTVYLSYGNKSMSGTNNTPVSVEINALKLTFN